MTFQDKIRKLRQTRASALQSLKGVKDGKAQLLVERDFNFEYLFGRGEHAGINDIFALYYQELSIGVGRTTSAPNIANNNASDWVSKLKSAVGMHGDDDIYPRDPETGIGVKAINKSSAWFGDNADGGQTSGGAVQDANAVIDSIGTTADSSTTKTSPDYGSGLIGQRTADNEQVRNPGYVDEETTPGAPEYYYGDGNPDTPDYFDSPEREELLSSTSSLLSALDTYVAKLDELHSELDNINAGTNDLFVESGMDSDSHINSNLIGDISSIESLKSGVVAYRDSIQSLYDYFAAFSAATDISDQAGYDRSEFDSSLNSLIDDCDGVITTLQQRASTIPGKLGDVNNGLRKWRLFWITENIVKPSSPMVALDGIEVALSNATDAVSNVNASMSTLFNNPEEWIAEPVVVAAFYNPVLDEASGQITTHRVGVKWVGSTFANRYTLLRRAIDDIGEDDTNWDIDTDVVAFVHRVDPNSGLVETAYEDESISPGNTYVYRAIAEDTDDSTTAPVGFHRTDPYQNSGSRQGPVFNPDKEGVVTSVDTGTITLSEETAIRKGDMISLSGTGQVDGRYRVKSASANKVVLEDPAVDAPGAEGTIRAFYAAVTIPT